jgi:hypothetical protein
MHMHIHMQVCTYRRASASVLSGGGFSTESGAAMRPLIPALSFTLTFTLTPTFTITNPHPYLHLLSPRPWPRPWPRPGAAMQQLIDLHAMLDQLDVRDDHLCEERGLRATQELLREALLRPPNPNPSPYPNPNPRLTLTLPQPSPNPNPNPNQALLRPLKRIWDEHSRSWFCGVKIRPEDQALYVRSGKRKGGIIDVE